MAKIKQIHIDKIVELRSQGLSFRGIEKYFQGDYSKSSIERHYKEYVEKANTAAGNAPDDKKKVVRQSLSQYWDEDKAAREAEQNQKFCQRNRHEGLMYFIWTNTEKGYTHASDAEFKEDFQRFMQTITEWGTAKTRFIQVLHSINLVKAENMIRISKGLPVVSLTEDQKDVLELYRYYQPKVETDQF